METRAQISRKIEVTDKKLSKIKLKVTNIPQFQKRIEKTLSKNVTDLIELLLAGSVLLNVSDIHIEPKETNTRIRIRVDGILQDVLDIPTKIYQTLLSRIKLLSEIKLNIIDRPQDGRFSVLLGETPVEIRSSTLPAEHGESIVLRILNPKSLIEVEALGVRKDLLEAFKKEIKRPNGMIIVTGPTGAGKTTTQYAFLEKINNPEIKIITIEDPIEYHLKGISQTQVNPKKGYDFANGLKSIMRQDPDVILVGEIRDIETVNIALQAALTGHLVFTTLHTNNAAGTIARLQALGGKPVNIAPALNMAIAQRLIRKVCKKCVKIEKVSPVDLQKLKKNLERIPKEKLPKKITKDIKIPKTQGCEHCNFTGYRGRIGIFETIFADEELENFILTSPSISALEKKAKEKGMISMHQDGLLKVLEGITTLEEVERITGE